MDSFKFGKSIQILSINVCYCKQTGKQARKQGEMTIKAQTKDKNKKTVTSINTRHYVGHKKCTIYIFVK